ncbi:transglycosylase [Klebsiella phage vB_KvM-Eowyn]|uniref:Lytic transglycosylase n=1 Tax=Klebsiella phage vB_KvM-Eowyn TaxID=2762819 RepID=A0A7R8MK61_9CAUD|nr:transglycosylase [Klebsiella phage vB_KvM-Eowyn]CAD5236123.1 lytic transglycosylase [Klebsiella phage vB_KvM-Eowyn]
MTTHTTFKTIVVLAIAMVIAGIFSLYAPNTSASLSTAVPTYNAVKMQPVQAKHKLPLETATVSKTVALRYTTLPRPKVNGLESHKNLIELVAKYTGVQSSLLASTAGIESRYISHAKNKGGSSAQGLCQFTKSTWRATAKKYGKQYGITPSTSRLDPRANLLLCAEHIKENDVYLTKVLKRPAKPSEIYMAHFLGSGGAVALLKAKPGSRADHATPSAARNNPRMFYGKKGNAYTVADFKRTIKIKVQREQSNFAALVNMTPSA